MSTVTNPQVSRNEQVLFVQTFSVRWGRNPQSVHLHRAGASIFYVPLLDYIYTRLSLDQSLRQLQLILSSFCILSFVAVHTLMGSVWLICCRMISWVSSGLFLLCPGSVPPSRSRSLPTQRQHGSAASSQLLKQKATSHCYPTKCFLLTKGLIQLSVTVAHFFRYIMIIDDKEQNITGIRFKTADLELHVL